MLKGWNQPERSEDVSIIVITFLFIYSIDSGTAITEFIR